jgi:MFS family permease
MKTDLVGPERRGLAMGLNEFAGYVAVAAAAWATGWVAARDGLRPEPFYLGILFVAFGLGLSVLLIRDTKPHVDVESRLTSRLPGASTASEIFWNTSVADRNLSSVSQAGLVNNLNDGMAWGLFPLFFATAGMGFQQIAVLAAIYPATWGIAQLGTGALSDHIGRKWLIATGMWIQALGIVFVAVSLSFVGFAAGSTLLGVGTAMVYPTLLAAIGDVAAPDWRASAIGVYRFWRDLGYAVGAAIAGVCADLLGMNGALWIVAGLTFASGVVVSGRMSETVTRFRVPGTQESHHASRA